MAKERPQDNEDTYMISKHTCTCCGKTLSIREFYKSDSFIYRAIGILPICKSCIVDLYNKLLVEDCRKNPKMAIYVICRILDLYFNENLFLAVQSQAENQGTSIVQVYFQKINSMIQYKGKKFIDSNILDTSKDNLDFEFFMNGQQAKSDIEITPEMYKRWGRNLSPDDYETLENNYQEFITSYESKTPAQRNIYVDIARTRLEAKKCLEKGRITEYEKMMNTISKLMNDGNIKPVQETGADVDGLSTWGQWVRKIEETEPIPEPSEEFKDVDGIGKYIKGWFTKQFYKILGSNIDSDIDLSLEEEIKIDESYIEDEEDEVEETKVVPVKNKREQTKNKREQREDDRPKKRGRPSKNKDW